MSAAGYDLPPELLTRLFQQRIVPGMLAGAEATNKTLIIVGAQPGAGKTRANAIALLDHPDAVEVNGDDLRVYHPAFNELMRNNPLAMPDATAHASGAWVAMSLDYLREHGRSVLLETTLRQPELLAETAHRFRAASYAVELRALAVPGAVSQLGTLTRYATQLASSGSGRWTPSHFHRLALDQSLHTVRSLIAGGMIDRVIIQSREGARLYDRHIDPDANTDYDGHEASDYLARARHLEDLAPEAADAWVKQYLDAARIVLSHQHVDDDVLATLRELGRYADTISRAAHPHDLDARRATAAQITETSNDAARGLAINQHRAAAQAPTWIAPQPRHSSEQPRH